MSSLRDRARPPRPDEAAAMPWLQPLRPADRALALEHVRVTEAEAGDRICRVGVPAGWWLGVVDGLLKMSNETPDGGSITFLGLPPGAWFGEGTLLKRECYRYNIEALRPSVVAGLPLEMFHRLLEGSIEFNRVILTMLNERLGQFVAAREIDRVVAPDVKVARSLAGLMHPVLYPGLGRNLRITQQELAWLVGLSRQRVNRALSALERAGLIRVDYGGIEILDHGGLRAFEAHAA